ncbi:MAG: hypothetical protein IPG39_10635 [Bacteroidetes bacterium]|nr:hypothetical protein [Bacteroidota bacterium]
MDSWCGRHNQLNYSLCKITRTAVQVHHERIFSQSNRTTASSRTPKELTITGITADSKVFDGNTNATLSGTAALSGPVDLGTNSSGPVLHCNWEFSTHHKELTVINAVHRIKMTNVLGLGPELGDIAVIAYNTSVSPDNFSILVLTDMTSGTKFFVNDNEVSSAGGSSFTDLSEGEAVFTVKAGQTIAAGTVIVLPWGGGAVSTATYDWTTTSGFGLGNNNEEIYIYNDLL